MPDYRTLQEAIAEVGAVHPRNGFTFQGLTGAEVTYTFPELESATARCARALQSRGFGKGDRLGMIVIQPEQFVVTFLAAIRIGVVPVPAYPPLYLSSIDAYRRQTGNILRSAGIRGLVTSATLAGILSTMAAEVPSIELPLMHVEDLTSEDDGQPDYPDVSPDDLAFLQYTSGSTTEPRGVMVTHACLVSNIHCFMGHGLRMDPARDVGVSWLPLYHDMGLVGFVLGPLYWGVSVVLIPTMRFVKNASVWMDAVHRHRATVSFAPNFAFALAARRARPADLGRWDLSCVKALGCGAEPIHLTTTREFTQLFRTHCGLRPHVIMPAYGLAEATLAVTMKPLDREIESRRVDSKQFQSNGVAVFPRGDADIEEHVSCGVQFPGHEVAIRGEVGEAMPDGVQGEIVVRGRSIAAGYFGDRLSTESTWRDGWLYTGDLGYLHEGQLYVTGRRKDLIVINGRKLHPQAIEWTVAEVEGVRGGQVVAFSRLGEDTEELVVALETKAKDRTRMIPEIEESVRSMFSVNIAEVVCLEPGGLPKTSSGKVQRSKVRQQYLSDRLGREGRRDQAMDTD